MRIGTFGSVVFETSSTRVFTPGSLSRERKARFEEHKVLGAKPRLEFLAPELTTISFSVQLLAAFCDPLASIHELAALCEAGQVEYLILGGENLGHFVLESVSEAWKQIAGLAETLAYAQPLSECLIRSWHT